MRRITALLLLALCASGCLHKKLGPGVRGRPDDDEAWGDAGDAEAALGNTPQALTDYQRAWMLDPRDSEWQRKVAQYGGEDLFRTTLDTLLPDSTTDDEAVGDRADAFSNAGYTGEACSLYSLAQSLDPQDTEWAGKVSECATPIAEEGPYPQPPDPSTYGALATLGYVGGVEGGVEGGVVGGVLGTLESDASGLGGLGYGYGYGSGYYDDGYVEPPLSDTAAITAALDHARAGQKVEARNALWVALQTDPTARDLHAMWTLLTGESAVVLLQKLADAHPDDPALWGALGDAKLTAGKRAEAIVAWQKAAALAPDDVAWSNRLEMAKGTAVK